MSRIPWLRHAGVRSVVLVGCGKAKSDKPARARELYTSPLFRKSLELAELVGDAVYVISAAHGLLSLDDIVEPYDHTMTGKSAAEREQWAVDVLKKIALDTLGSHVKLRVMILAGESYSKPLVAEIEKRLATGWVEPIDLLKGLQIGERLSFLNKAIVTALASNGARR